MLAYKLKIDFGVIGVLNSSVDSIVLFDKVEILRVEHPCLHIAASKLILEDSNYS